MTQRNASNQAALTVTGSSNSPNVDTVQARFQPRAGFAGTDTGWVTIGMAKTFSNAVTVSGGWYDLSVRALYQGVVVTTGYLNQIGVGDFYLIIGQSNAANLNFVDSIDPGEGVFQKSFQNANWFSGADPQRDASNNVAGTGTMWTRLAVDLIARDGIPLVFVDIAQGNTKVAEWVPGTGFWGASVTTAASLLGLNFKAVLFDLGETDTSLHTSQADFTSQLEQLIDGSRTAAGWNVPWYIATATRIQDAWNPNISAAEHDVADNYLNCHRGADLDSLGSSYRPDGTHFENAGLLAAGLLWRDVL